LEKFAFEQNDSLIGVDVRRSMVMVPEEFFKYGNLQFPPKKIVSGLVFGRSDYISTPSHGLSTVFGANSDVGKSQLKRVAKELVLNEDIFLLNILVGEQKFPIKSRLETTQTCFIVNTCGALQVELSTLLCCFNYSGGGDGESRDVSIKRKHVRIYLLKKLLCT
jgi:hypothetical protein